MNLSEIARIVLFAMGGMSNRSQVEMRNRLKDGATCRCKVNEVSGVYWGTLINAKNGGRSVSVNN